MPSTLTLVLGNFERKSVGQKKVTRSRDGHQLFPQAHRAMKLTQVTKTLVTPVLERPNHLLSSSVWDAAEA